MRSISQRSRGLPIIPGVALAALGLATVMWSATAVAQTTTTTPTTTPTTTTTQPGVLPGVRSGTPQPTAVAARTTTPGGQIQELTAREA
jgi:hypothetical protein